MISFSFIQHGDATFAIPDGAGMVTFVERIADEPEKVKDEAARMVDHALERASQFQKHGALDGVALCADDCFNSAPFLSPGARAKLPLARRDGDMEGDA